VAESERAENKIFELFVEFGIFDEITSDLAHRNKLLKRLYNKTVESEINPTSLWPNCY
jgi:hypothetical protein